MNKEAKGIWRRLHQMTQHTRHVVYITCAVADLSCVTDRLTDTANIGNNSLYVMHSMQPKTIWLTVMGPGGPLFIY